MKEYKLAAFDMDGTLLDSDKKIREDSLKTLHKASEAGKILCLSTGRNFSELKEYEKELSVMNYIMCISGALIIDNKTKEIIYSREIELAYVPKLFEIHKKFDTIVHIHSNLSRFQPQDIELMESYGMGAYRTLFERVCCFHDNLFEDYLKEPFPVYKFNYYCKSPEERLRVEEAIKSSDILLSTCYAETKSLECSPLGISKLFGLKYLCEINGIDISQAIAVGDADNDLEILESAGLGIAMGNANENAKAAADVLVADCDHGGIAEAIEKYLL